MWDANVRFITCYCVTAFILFVFGTFIEFYSTVFILYITLAITIKIQKSIYRYTRYFKHTYRNSRIFDSFNTRTIPNVLCCHIWSDLMYSFIAHNLHRTTDFKAQYYFSYQFYIYFNNSVSLWLPLLWQIIIHACHY